jgi:hypothetical protein
MAGSARWRPRRDEAKARVCAMPARLGRRTQADRFAQGHDG